jgi:hypothetical protein
MKKKSNPIRSFFDNRKARKAQKKRQKKAKEDNPHIYPLF